MFGKKSKNPLGQPKFYLARRLANSAKTREARTCKPANSSAADILSGKRETKNQLQVREEKNATNNRPDAAEILFGDMRPKNPHEEKGNRHMEQSPKATRHDKNTILKTQKTEDKTQPEQGKVKSLPPGTQAAIAAALGISLPREWRIATLTVNGLTAIYYYWGKGRKELVGYMDETGNFLQELPNRKAEQIKEALAEGNYPAD